jgi:hypothetical protein
MRTSHRLTAVAVAVAAGIGVAGTAAHAHPGPSDSGSHARGHHERGLTPELRQVRRATRAFRDVKAAEAAGYEAASPCESDPKYGAMGIHYGNPELVADGKLDITRPEVLVYQPTPGGRLRLGAVEYFQPDADQDLATDADRPFLFDLPFDGPMLGHNPQMPVHYDLHVGLYRHNPAGLFAMWNPRVQCPDDPTGTS